LIANANGATATVAVRKAGTYVFKLTVTGNGGAAATDEVTVTVEPYQVIADVTVMAVPFTPSTTPLKFSVDGGAGNNYSFIGSVDSFVADDLSGITYTLSSVNPVKDLSAYSNGNVPFSEYADNEYPTITQTFYYNGQVVGSRKVVTIVSVVDFIGIYEYKPTEIEGVWYDSDFVDISAIPTTTLNNLRKDITELP